MATESHHGTWIIEVFCTCNHGLNTSPVPLPPPIWRGCGLFDMPSFWTFAMMTGQSKLLNHKISITRLVTSNMYWMDKIKSQSRTHQLSWGFLPLASEPFQQHPSLLFCSCWQLRQEAPRAWCKPKGPWRLESCHHNPITWSYHQLLFGNPLKGGRGFENCSKFIEFKFKA